MQSAILMIVTGFEECVIFFKDNLMMMDDF